MKPYSWTPDGEMPDKEDGGKSWESNSGKSYKQTKKERKEAQRANQLANKKARKYYKNEIKRQLEDDWDTT